MVGKYNRDLELLHVKMVEEKGKQKITSCTGEAPQPHPEQRRGARAEDRNDGLVGGSPRVLE
ncbi:MAG: hypothetical protein IPF99_15480 [Deltaproteobacteria bacterium]|nr:hypothetical protein [Deltaproteobacteria bacterium]